MNLFALGTALLLAVGWIWQSVAFPDKMPQQIIQFAPPEPAVASVPALAAPAGGLATYDPDSQTMTVETEITNLSQEPINLTQFTTTTLKFTTGSAAGPGVLVVAPDATIEPGSAPTKVTLTMQDPAWEAEHLVPIGESQLLISGVMVFETASGQKNYTELEANLTPRFD
jgi:methane/ammonia monooxygenase subunit B